jgi:hypothetical protein
MFLGDIRVRLGPGVEAFMMEFVPLLQTPGSLLALFSHAFTMKKGQVST